MTQIDSHTQLDQQKLGKGAARLRYAPSPTGFQHIGGFRTALFSWLYARHTGGQFILRIEDTDRTRLVAGALDNIVESLFAVGLNSQYTSCTGTRVEVYTHPRPSLCCCSRVLISVV